MEPHFSPATPPTSTVPFTVAEELHPVMEPAFCAPTTPPTHFVPLTLPDTEQFSMVYVGGVVGVQIGGSITGCSSSATVKGTVDVGGVAGQTNSSATLTACYATGNVIIEMDPKKNIAGGSLVGMNAGSSLLACYATGNVTSTGSSTGYMHIGGFLGNNYTTVTAGYWKNNHEQGIGYNRESTGATKVDGSVVTWQKAVDAMNTALQNAGSEWRYELKGALPTLRKQ